MNGAELLEATVLAVRRRPADPLAWRQMHDAALDCGVPWPDGWLSWAEAPVIMRSVLVMSRRHRRREVNRIRLDLERFLADALEKMGVPTPLPF